MTFEAELKQQVEQDYKQNKYQIIIFDWDGTLVDSTARIVDSMQMAADTVGLPRLEGHVIQQIIGLSLPVAIKQLWPQITTPQLDEMCTLYADNFTHHSKVVADLFPFAHSLFQQLRDAGYILAVATGKTRRGLDEMLTGLQVEDEFAITRCADEALSKPDPMMLKQILAELGLDYQQALMVGDTSFDLDMAAAIGMDSIGMSHGAHADEILLASGAKALCRDLPELLSWIKRNG